nr:copper amine oxidase N-terminal domain-containing protein [Cohnella sp. GbtcB17]
MLLAVPVAASAASATIAVESKPIVMEFDGKKLALPSGQVAFMYQSKVYIPLRFASYALQKQVGYDVKSKMVTVTEPTSSQLVALKEYLANATASSGQVATTAKVKLVPTAVKLVFDGVEKKLPVGQQAFNVNGSIYVPVRFFAEAVGTTVLWDAKTGTVLGESKAYREAQSNGGSTNEGSASGGGTEGKAGSGSNGSSSGGETAKLSYDSITASAKSQLETLETSCGSDLLSLALQYYAAPTAERQAELKEKGVNKLNACKAQFESILSDTENKLTTNGYSTEILTEYRKAFEEKIEAGKAQFKQSQ